MPENDDGDTRFNTYVISSLAVTSALLLLLPMTFVMGKDTAYSAYEEDDFYQLSDMRDTFSNEERYFVANTMSTPMLVNDWKDPHRTLLAIIGPEKPIDDTEANEIYKFVTERGGKVIVAADNTNANRLASMFGITFFNSPMLDEKQHWVVHDQQGQASAISWKNVWSASSVKQDVDRMSPGALMQGCTTFQIENYVPTDCRIPIMFRSPTGLKFEPLLRDTEDPGHRKIMTLARASPSAFIDIEGNGDPTDLRNPAPGDLKLIMRFDYPGIEVFDELPTESRGALTTGVGELEVTGSIVFVSDEEAFSNLLWKLGVAEGEGLSKDCKSVGDYTLNNCWTREILNNNEWNGNQRYFRLLVHDMMEFDNINLSAQIRQGDSTGDKSNFQIVFDESRHVTGVVSAPFVETMGTVVLLTSNEFLKWLVVLNVGLLLLVAMMVVPERENWRHVFDLTRFNQRPNKLDPSGYRKRVQQALFTKIRVQNDLTRDEMASKPPPEIQALIGDPRLVELAYSQSRTYSPQELRKLMQAIRRWGKDN